MDGGRANLRVVDLCHRLEGDSVSMGKHCSGAASGKLLFQLGGSFILWHWL